MTQGLTKILHEKSVFLLLIYCMSLYVFIVCYSSTMLAWKTWSYPKEALSTQCWHLTSFIAALYKKAHKLFVDLASLGK